MNDPEQDMECWIDETIFKRNFYKDYYKKSPREQLDLRINTVMRKYMLRAFQEIDQNS